MSLNNLVNPLRDKNARQFPDRSVNKYLGNHVNKSQSKIANLYPDRNVYLHRDKFAKLFRLKIANKPLNKTANRLYIR